MFEPMLYFTLIKEIYHGGNGNHFSKELINSSTAKNYNTNNIIALFPVCDSFSILVDEFKKTDVEIVRVCHDMENIILPDDYVIQCMANRYNIIKIKINNDSIVTTIIMTTDDAEHLAGVIELHQTFIMMDEQFQV